VPQAGLHIRAAWLRPGGRDELGAVLDHDSLPGQLLPQDTFGLGLGDEQHVAVRACAPGEPRGAEAAGGSVDGRRGDPVAGGAQLRPEAALVQEIERAQLQGQGARPGRWPGAPADDADLDPEAGQL
jgi:hypothetical protein